MQDLNSALDGFGWLDTKPSLRQWFADWLTSSWTRLYGDSIRQLHTKEQWAKYDAMKGFIKTFTASVRHLTTAEQLARLDSKARTLSFIATRDRVESELKYFLTRQGRQKRHSAAFKASPWCNHFAMRKHTLERAGFHIPQRHYPKDSDARLALEQVISEFGSLLIHRHVSPALSQLLAMQRDLAQFEESSKSLPGTSPLLHPLRKLKLGLQKYSALLEPEIRRLTQDPMQWVEPLRARREQQCLYLAIRRLCRSKAGPNQLAQFVTELLKHHWPELPAGMAFDFEGHFDPESRRTLVANHLGVADPVKNKEGRALCHVLNAIIVRDTLRNPLLRLKVKAHQQAKEHRKGWPHLRKALKAVFSHIGRTLSDEEMFRNFERANFAYMRNLTREQRMRLLPELGRDPDSSVRDLSKKEKMFLFHKCQKRRYTPLEWDGDPRGSFATRYGRAMKAVRVELGQQ